MMLSKQQQELQNKLSSYSSMKVLQILLALSATNKYMGISEVTDITGLSGSTLHRILQELLECGFVTKDEQQKKYRIGFESMALAEHMKAANYLLEAAKDEMHRLNEITKETVNLIVRDGCQAAYIGKMEAKNQIAMRSKIGWKIPLYCTSGGKLLLAYQDEKWLENYLSSTPLEKYTDYTIVDKAALMQELVNIRKENFAIDNQEHNPDVICIAAPIFSDNHEILATIGVAAPNYRFSLEKALSYKEAVINAGNAVSEKIAK
ncbi:IclR family transcriptional regulator [Caproicibacter sp.]|uniref:IclR family transcriptional regulator n=1 Tax=Caproicibacter sp. TaxID=2814884 RepID=UPI00398A28B1